MESRGLPQKLLINYTPKMYFCISLKFIKYFSLNMPAKRFLYLVLFPFYMIIIFTTVLHFIKIILHQLSKYRTILKTECTILPVLANKNTSYSVTVICEFEIRCCGVPIDAVNSFELSSVILD